MSGYIERTIVTELPTTLETGREVYYQDANGNLTLWVGHADGSAWPAVGYKEYRALVIQSGTDNPVITVRNNDLPFSIPLTRGNSGRYDNASEDVIDAIPNQRRVIWFETDDINGRTYLMLEKNDIILSLATLVEGQPSDGVFTTHVGFELTFRIYP